ncbi:MAG: hypothetical protein IIB19_05230 [Chloroflexi bacterium]|nr:hypothetical protein [Chloroflexota bacterium]
MATGAAPVPAFVPLALGLAVMGMAFALVLPGPPSEGKREMGLAGNTDAVKWGRSGWEIIATQASGTMSDSYDIAVQTARQVFPMQTWPTTASAPADRRKLWARIQLDVAQYLARPATMGLVG